MAPSVDALKISRREETVLALICVAFLTFAIVEMIYAYSSGSLALLGDAAAMLVDACTYIFNGCAIRRTRLRGREDKWAVLGPVVSTAVLVGAMIYIMIDAIQTLVANENGDVDEVVVLAFGLANLAVDIFAAVLFLAYPDAYRAVMLLENPESLEADGGLNMQSALTHVLADTYRTLAVLSTASVALSMNNVNSTKADAWGALAVELPVLVMCVNLSRAAIKRYLRAEPADVAMEHVDANSREAKGTAPLTRDLDNPSELA
mmetsp:Transcript_2842/g.8589  ORF Transcript_2842/g.8589 Transcript_2842/m.8589 type:complete len:262 (-) Transcript_2842:56-841(-)